MSKDVVVCVQLTEEEHERLKSVAAHYGLSRPEALRYLIKKDSDRVDGLLWARGRISP